MAAQSPGLIVGGAGTEGAVVRTVVANDANLDLLVDDGVVSGGFLSINLALLVHQDGAGVGTVGAAPGGRILKLAAVEAVG